MQPGHSIYSKQQSLPRASFRLCASTAEQSVSNTSWSRGGGGGRVDTVASHPPLERIDAFKVQLHLGQCICSFAGLWVAFAGCRKMLRESCKTVGMVGNTDLEGFLAECSDCRSQRCWPASENNGIHVHKRSQRKITSFFAEFKFQVWLSKWNSIYSLR